MTIATSHALRGAPSFKTSLPLCNPTMPSRPCFYRRAFHPCAAHSLWSNHLHSFVCLRKSLYVPRRGKPIIIAPLGILTPILLSDDNAIFIASLSACDHNESKPVSFLYRNSNLKYFQVLPRTCAPDRTQVTFSLRFHTQDACSYWYLMQRSSTPKANSL